MLSIVVIASLVGCGYQSKETTPTSTPTSTPVLIDVVTQTVTPTCEVVTVTPSVEEIAELYTSAIESVASANDSPKALRGLMVLESVRKIRLLLQSTDDYSTKSRYINTFYRLSNNPDLDLQLKMIFYGRM